MLAHDRKLSFGMMSRIALLSVAAIGATRAIGASVTLHFDAEVASIIATNGGSLLLPPMAIGDRIRGDFTFETSAPGLNHPQQSDFRVYVGGTRFEVGQYSITVRDEYEGLIPYAGTLADPHSVPIDDRAPGGVSDSLWIGGAEGSSGPIDVGLGGVDNGMQWWAATSFAGNESILSSSLVPHDAESWNAMAFKEIAMNFTDVGTGASTRIGAYITVVTAIPEPATSWTTFILLSTCLFILDRSHRSRR